MEHTDEKTAGTALVLGATSLVGSHLLNMLLEDGQYAAVKVFVRRKIDMQHPRLQVQVVDFDRPETWHRELKGEVLFSTLGTTLRQAGSQDAQYRVDYTYQHEAARAAAANGVETYVLVSSAGADANARVFYSRRGHRTGTGQVAGAPHSAPEKIPAHPCRNRGAGDDSFRERFARNARNHLHTGRGVFFGLKTKRGT